MSVAFSLFVFGLLYAYFQIMPAFLRTSAWESLTWGDIHDFLTPFVVIPCVFVIYLSLKKHHSEAQGFGFARLAAKPVLALGILLYVNGHGLHLSANAIARVAGQTVDSKVFQTVYFFDEIISHFFWDIGTFLISLGIILLASGINVPSHSRVNVFLLVCGAVLYGFCFAVNGIEGQTVVFVVPAACVGVAVTFLAVKKNRKKDLYNPVHIFFLIAYFLSLVLFAYWRITQGGFPQFSELKMI